MMMRNFEEALANVERGLKIDPGNHDLLMNLGQIGSETRQHNLELRALVGLYETGGIRKEMMPRLCELLFFQRRYDETILAVEETIPLMPRMKMKGKRQLKKNLLAFEGGQ